MRLFLPLLLASGLATADDAGILRCRAVTEPAARLVCYEKVECDLVPAISETYHRLGEPLLSGGRCGTDCSNPNSTGRYTDIGRCFGSRDSLDRVFYPVSLSRNHRQIVPGDCMEGVYGSL